MNDIKNTIIGKPTPPAMSYAVKGKSNKSSTLNKLIQMKNLVIGLKGCEGIKVPISSMNLLKKSWLMLLSISLMVLPACKELDPASKDLIKAIAEKLSFSVLVINLQGIEQNYGGINVPWQERYGRIAAWIRKDSVPDIIALQEVHVYSGNISPYQPLNTLIDQIKQKTGVEYGIAYSIVSPTRQGLRPTLWAGNALLYNRAKFSKADLNPTNQPVYDFNDEAIAGVHLRKSPPYSFSNAVMEGEGLAWISAYTHYQDVLWPRRWRSGPAFIRLMLKDAPGSYIHIYNMHIAWSPDELNTPTPTRYKEAFYGLLEKMETQFGNARLYPPIVLGDFNLGFQPENPDVLIHFPKFEVATGFPHDVMGILVGKQSEFPCRLPRF